MNNIDIKEINALKFNMGIRYHQKKFLGFTFKKNFVTGCVNFLVKFTLSLFKYPLSYHCIDKKKGRIMFLCNTRNQELAVSNIINQIDSTIPAHLVRVTDMPMSLAYIYSFPYIYKFLKFYINSSSNEKAIIGNEFTAFLRSYGDYILFSKLYRRWDAKVVVFANDHTSTMRAAMMAANNLSIETIYVQHAAVTDKFPKLIARHAFLDGKDAYEKYSKRGIESKCLFLIGGTRFDNIINNFNNSQDSGIGIALTLKDTCSYWKNVVLKLKECYNPDILTIRPHPGMDLNSIRDFCDREQIKFSNPKTEDSFTFLSKQHFLIANETSIHLDSAIMHVKSVLCSCMSELPFTDHYGLVRSKVIERVSRLDELLEYMENSDFKPAEEFIRNFNASYNTIVEGKVSELVSCYIKCLVKGEYFRDNRLACENNIYTIKVC